MFYFSMPPFVLSIKTSIITELQRPSVLWAIQDKTIEKNRLTDRNINKLELGYKRLPLTQSTYS